MQVTDEIDDGERTRRVINPTETAAAQEKAQALQERFAEWCWEEPDRARRLAGEYNQRFNSLVLRDYSQGRAADAARARAHVHPAPHQRAAVARMLSEPAVGLFHQVGAGKTAEMVIGASELRRLGMVKKPAVVVPNHMLEQFTRESSALPASAGPGRVRRRSRRREAPRVRRAGRGERLGRDHHDPLGV